ncbi:unnamed protein product, partial [Meganyctiphanes norvegica]
MLSHKNGVMLRILTQKNELFFKYGLRCIHSGKKRRQDFRLQPQPYKILRFNRTYSSAGQLAQKLKISASKFITEHHPVIVKRSLSYDWGSHNRWRALRSLHDTAILLPSEAKKRDSWQVILFCRTAWQCRANEILSVFCVQKKKDGTLKSFLTFYFSTDFDNYIFLLFRFQFRKNLSPYIFKFLPHFLRYLSDDDFLICGRRHMSSDSVGSERLDGCVLLDVDGLSSAGSSTSLNSSCSSNRSSHHAPTIFIKTGRDHDNGYNANLTWPYGSFTGELDFDDMSPNLSRTSSSSSHHGAGSHQAFPANAFRDCEKSSSSSINGRLSVKKSVETTISATVPRTNSCSIRNGSSNGCVPEPIVSSVASVTTANSRPLVCPVRTKRQSDSSGESVGSSIGGVSIDIDSVVNNVCSVTPHATTSPMAVPVPRGRNACTRTRNESVSSVGSWQIISGTGSLRSSCGSQVPSSSGSKGSHTVPVDMVDSATTIKEEVGSLHSASSEQSIIVFNRADRLSKVRSMFYNIYCTSIGFKFSNGRTESGLGNLMNNFAAKVGIKTATPRTTS